LILNDPLGPPIEACDESDEDDSDSGLDDVGYGLRTGKMGDGNQSLAYPDEELKKQVSLSRHNSSWNMNDQCDVDYLGLGASSSDCQVITEGDNFGAPSTLQKEDGGKLDPNQDAIAHDDKNSAAVDATKTTDEIVVSSPEVSMDPSSELGKELADFERGENIEIVSHVNRLRV
jgi:hypothetical protein